jgi:hypothetical protein
MEKSSLDTATSQFLSRQMGKSYLQQTLNMGIIPIMEDKATVEFADKEYCDG